MDIRCYSTIEYNDVAFFSNTFYFLFEKAYNKKYLTIEFC